MHQRHLWSSFLCKQRRRKDYEGEKVTSSIKAAQQKTIPYFIKDLLGKIPKSASFVRNVATLYVLIGVCFPTNVRGAEVPKVSFVGKPGERETGAEKA